MLSVPTTNYQSSKKGYTSILDEPHWVNPECEAKVHRVRDTDAPAGMVVKDESGYSIHAHVSLQAHIIKVLEWMGCNE